jgi:hypothetical protein
MESLWVRKASVDLSTSGTFLSVEFGTDYGTLTVARLGTLHVKFCLLDK